MIGLRRMPKVGVEDARGDWDADRVVGERKDQIFTDVAHRGAA